MSKINIPMDGVVIGSNTIAEHKMQALNFMNMLYNISFNNANRDNINPWINNLKYEINYLRREKCYNKDSYHIEKNIELFKQKMLDKTVKKSDWKNLLENIAKVFEIEYTLN